MKVYINKAQPNKKPPEVKVTITAEIQVPVHYLTGEDPPALLKPGEEAALIKLINEDHVYSQDEGENLMSILADCGLFGPNSVKDLDITILPIKETK